ncbi:MAG: 2,3-diaminopropionate biosynthesis protein SbnB [Bacteroidota bacterium]
MIYLNADNIKDIGIHWHQLIKVIETSILALHKKDYSQPIKPYLRYGDPKNRIIAMPAYIGGDAPYAGIKWIASFPDNIHKNKLRAHSVTILNEYDSGIPLCVINTAIVSAIRTASLSGLVVKEYLKTKIEDQPFTVGIIGFGPIGQMHLNMITAVLGNRATKIKLFDINPIDISTIDNELADRIEISQSWQECYADTDIFMTCTVSDKPYIDVAPKKGSLQLNVSLRDYKAEMRQYMDVIIVDDWDEVCRQNTDIENMHQVTGLQKSDTISIVDLVCYKDSLSGSDDQVVMLNPMGMAVFDIAVGGYYYREALSKNVGLQMV